MINQDDTGIAKPLIIMKSSIAPIVLQIFKKYPESIQKKMLFLRQLIIDIALEADGVSDVEETLKWGEPSYVTKSGSTIRMGWRKSQPDHYALYFHCKTTLIDTFKELYGDTFRFEGNRAIVFSMDDEVPVSELKHCIFLSLTYHKRKHLPLLGA